MKYLGLLVLVPLPAFATPPSYPPSNPSTEVSSSSHSSSYSDADANAHAASVGIAQGGSAAAQGGTASSESGDSLSSSANTNTLGNNTAMAAAGDASSGGNSLSTSTANRTRVTAIGLSAVSAAPIDTTSCRVGQTAGWRVGVVERTGRNKIDPDCMAELRAEQAKAANFGRCMDLARAYQSWPELYVRQLAACGGVEGVVAEATVSKQEQQRKPVTETSSNQQCATQEGVNRAFEACARK